MPADCKEYSKLSDQELIDGLLAKPIDEKLHNYFFTKKCRKFLNYISSSIYSHDNEEELLGEFYEFISKDDWKLLRKWENRNGASLYSYLAYCATNYFVQKQTVEKKRQELYVNTPYCLFEQLTDSIEEEQEEETGPDTLTIWKAFNMLNKRDQTILRKLVIDECSILEAAPEIWKYIRHNKPLEEMEHKRVQCTISMAKYRAQLLLLNNIKQITESSC